ncbi:LytR/AlgR family response regulator transcription factor [Flavihumibacter fluvii]|uniref:LytR/AlgR family response regulator transcription factor n=1 Tax=Flavihumibacter fluvii TaxID=2838157 RepID=UPI001BDF54DE|nr:LytTR family DNA-binding domain-containing protein [Flavihumibacter fluvii]ULQ51711.1 LytTR family transcriptional regulator DNA-binding domain-containing protein [Flavihumibacter fluvii]
MLQEHIFFNAEKHLARIRIADIMFVESKHRHVHIFCTDNVWDLRMSLDQLQTKLPSSMFVRIHRSYLVALQHITFYMDSVVHLGDFELPVQHGKVNEFKDAIDIINRERRNRSKLLSKYKKL